MGGYRVEVIETKGLRQRFHVRILASNGQVLFWSEKYRNRGYALELATNVATALGVGVVEFK